MDKPRQFAKLFETERGQILVLRQSSDETGNPEVRFFFDPNHPDLTVCSFALSWGDTDKGHEIADRVFIETEQDGAERAVFKQIDEITSMLAQREAGQ